jgi:hypothetical protein
LCMSIRNNTYYESLVMGIPVQREARVDASGLVHAPTAIGMGHESTWEIAPWLNPSLVI